MNRYALFLPILIALFSLSPLIARTSFDPSVPSATNGKPEGAPLPEEAPSTTLAEPSKSREEHLGKSERAKAEITTKKCGDHEVVTLWRPVDGIADYFSVTFLIFDKQDNLKRVLQRDGGATKRWVPFHCEDLNNDGKPELLFRDYSGGAHCCETLSVYTLGDEVKNILVFYGNNGGLERTSDLDGDGIREIIYRYDGYAYFAGLSYAGSPKISLVLCNSEGRYHDCTTRFPEVVKADKAYYKEKSKEFLHKGSALGFLAASILLGEEEEAWTYLEKSVEEADLEWLKRNEEQILSVLYKRRFRIDIVEGNIIPHSGMYVIQGRDSRIP